MIQRSLLTCLVAVAAATPTDLSRDNIERRQLLNLLPVELALKELDAAIQGTTNPFPALLSVLEGIIPGPTPASIEDATSILSSLHADVSPTGYFQQSAALIAAGITSNDLQGIIAGFTTENNATNVNPRLPASKAVYPKKAAGDAPYSEREKALRQQIYIPPDFTYGKKPPVILIPGTGERGGNTYSGNFRKLLRGSAHADPVLLNYPGYGLADCQQNAESVAYAINYIAAITGKNVSAIAWSQGNINVQWALKYWPSTRSVLSNSIAFSPDYHGTLVATLLRPTNPGVPLPPSLIQQAYSSNFIKALRANGGDSAYVPTTTIYSGFFDEIVEPQQGTSASGFLLDARNVGVTNVDIPKVCPPGSPAGAFVDHESLLFNSLTYSLVIDALTNAGPANLSRIDLKSVCSHLAAPGLTVVDVLDTESTIPFAGYQIAVYTPKVGNEPPIRHYARAG